MKLIIRQYLSSLRERGELDAILPDLLSEMGLNVFSRPGRGTRQEGVDVAAVGTLESAERVYLFSIKPGDLTRRDWDGGSPQSLRPSLNEIVDSYIPNRIPVEHRGKSITVCICIGGDIREEVRTSVEGFCDRNTREGLSFEQWNGDKLASYIQDYFLREEFLPENARSSLRKSLAMLDEPETSHRYFSNLMESFTSEKFRADVAAVKALRQISICLWILFSWSRDAGNLESAYRSSEVALLSAWRIAASFGDRSSKEASQAVAAFQSILSTYQQICGEYLNKCVLPHVGKRDGLSSAIRGPSSVDINLKLFDLLSRLALDGLWAYWLMTKENNQNLERMDACRSAYQQCASATKAMIANNSALFLPVADDLAIDICLAVLMLAVDPNNSIDVEHWLKEIVERASFALSTNGRYPCNIKDYSDLLDHPQREDDGYRVNATAGSILYPMIALWAALFDFDELYAEVAEIKTKHLQHCNFQFWYPDETSEENFYSGRDTHGAVLSNAPVDQSMENLLSVVFSEAEHTPHFKELSAVKYGYWPIVAVSCRYFRYPVPIQFLRGFWRGTVATPAST